MIADTPDVPPSPFTPDSGGTVPHGQIGPQYERRRLILATARRLIAEGGSAALTVQRLAQECATSRQNIHNIVGTKKDIISMSLIEYNERIFSHAVEICKTHDLYRAFLDTYWRVAKAYPDYISEAERLMFSDHDLYRGLVRNSARHFLPFLKNLLGVSQLKKEHWDLSYQLLSVPNNAVRDWMEGGCSIDEMFDNWIFGADIIVSGALMKFKAAC